MDLEEAGTKLLQQEAVTKQQEARMRGLDVELKHAFTSLSNMEEEKKLVEQALEASTVVAGWELTLLHRPSPNVGTYDSSGKTGGGGVGSQCLLPRVEGGVRGWGELYHRILPL